LRLSDQLASFAEGLDLGIGDEIQVHNIWNVRPEYGSNYSLKKNGLRVVACKKASFFRSILSHAESCRYVWDLFQLQNDAHLTPFRTVALILPISFQPKWNM
jgi:hypothetical protein